MQVVIVGGGIAGLATAHFLRAADAGLDVTVVEAAPQAGGKVRTLHRDGRHLDLGPNGWLSGEPALERLLDELDLHELVVAPAPAARRRWVHAEGHTHEVPTSPPALLKASLLSRSARLRILGDLVLPRGDLDVTVGAWAARRFGADAVDRLVAPMIAGIHGADPDSLSLAAALPRVHALATEHRSLILGGVRRARGSAPRAALQTLPNGAGQLTETLAARLGPSLHLSTAARALEVREHRWRIHVEPGDPLDADAVVLACPAAVQARLVRGMDPELAAPLDAITTAPMGVLIARADPGTWPTEPDGFGVLAARGTDLGGVLGVLFTSCVFPDQAHPGEHLFRVFLGGSVHPEVLDLDDQQLIGRARGALDTILGPAREPFEVLHLGRHPHAIPQYTPGHLGRVAAIRAREARHPGLFCTGNHLEGIAVKDTVRAALSTAERVTTVLGDEGLQPR